MAHHTHTRPSAILNKKMTNFSGKIKDRVGGKIVMVDVLINKQRWLVLHQNQETFYMSFILDAKTCFFLLLL
jgi:hypothetical protein